MSCDDADNVCLHGVTTQSFILQKIVFQKKKFLCIIEAILDNLCMDREWLDGASWDSTSLMLAKDLKKI